MSRKKSGVICAACGSDTRYQPHRISCKKAAKCVDCGKPSISAELARCAPCATRAAKEAEADRRRAVVDRKLRELDHRER